MNVNTYAYTPNGTALSGTPTKTETFTYSGDRLTSYGNRSISYNDMGCPVTFNGYNATWTRGKLSKLSQGSTSAGTHNYNYSYNAFGQRTSRSYSYIRGSSGISAVQPGMLMSSNRTYIYDNAGRLISESISKIKYGEFGDGETIVYLYDENSIIGMLYTANNTTNAYYFNRNIQGDVIGIYDTNGNKVAGYAYDAWGNCTIDSSTTNYDIAHDNPIRYRGYYYDEDTGLYYLNARYYNPEWRRFISPDDTAYLDPETPNGLNLYCYCGNDPVNYADPSGNFPVLAVILGITAAVGFGLSVGGVIADDNLLTAIGLTMAAIPALIAGGLAAFASTGALAIGIGVATMIAGGFTGIFAGAEYQEAYTGQNFILNTGISDGLYNTLMLTTAGLATLGTFASSFAYHFNINSINKIGTLEGTKYKGIRFTQKVQRAGGRQVELYRTLEWHTHSHNGYNPHWQMNNFSYYNEMWYRSDALARWTWWLTKIVD